VGVLGEEPSLLQPLAVAPRAAGGSYHSIRGRVKGGAYKVRTRNGYVG